nr:hypothetical protein [Sphingomonas deserti]
MFLLHGHPLQELGMCVLLRVRHALVDRSSDYPVKSAHPSRSTADAPFEPALSGGGAEVEIIDADDRGSGLFEGIGGGSRSWLDQDRCAGGHHAQIPQQQAGESS